eukprot:1750221-Rhodomonas_salina.2
MMITCATVARQMFLIRTSMESQVGEVGTWIPEEGTDDRFFWPSQCRSQLPQCKPSQTSVIVWHNILPDQAGLLRHCAGCYTGREKNFGWKLDRSSAHLL